jgi:hypothetical protein
VEALRLPAELKGFLFALCAVSRCQHRLGKLTLQANFLPGDRVRPRTAAEDDRDLQAFFARALGVPWPKQATRRLVWELRRRVREATRAPLVRADAQLWEDNGRPCGWLRLYLEVGTAVKGVKLFWTGDPAEPAAAADRPRDRPRRGVDPVAAMGGS